LTNRQIVLRRRPTGLVQPGDTELVTARAPEPADGEALVRTTYVGLDAAVRTWLNDQPGYLPPVQLGEVIRAAGIGEVVSSRCDAYAVGDVITTLTGSARPSAARAISWRSCRCTAQPARPPTSG
jgi:NADPH-dependent curcumin reductase CurA